MYNCEREYAGYNQYFPSELDAESTIERGVPENIPPPSIKRGIPVNIPPPSIYKSPPKHRSYKKYKSPPKHIPYQEGIPYIKKKPFENIEGQSLLKKNKTIETDINILKENKFTIIGLCNEPHGKLSEGLRKDLTMNSLKNNDSSYPSTSYYQTLSSYMISGDSIN